MADRSARESAGPASLRPISELNAVGRAMAWVVCVMLTARIAWFVAATTARMFVQSDAQWYVDIAQGRTDLVMQPFAARQLSSLLVKWVARAMHWSVWYTFWHEGTVWLLVVTAAVFWLALKTEAPRWLLAVLVLLTFWPQLMYGLPLPDLFYAALLCVVLLLLDGGQMVLAAAMIFPLMVARESTSLTLVCLLVAAWRPLRWWGRCVAVGGWLAGSMVVSHLARGAMANAERLPPTVYLALKAPWNLVRSFGVEPWSNLYPNCQVPQWQHAIHLGSVQALGVCRFDPETPMYAVVGALTTFGLLPILTAVVWWKAGKPWREAPVMVRFCLVYGAACFLLAPMLGTRFPRLFGYAWPLFLVALPQLFGRTGRNAMRSVRARLQIGSVGLFLALELALALMANWLYIREALGCTVLLTAMGILLIWRWFSAPVEGVSGA